MPVWATAGSAAKCSACAELGAVAIDYKMQARFDTDFKFACDMVVQHRHSLQSTREECLGRVRELSRRLAPVHYAMLRSSFYSPSQSPPPTQENTHTHNLAHTCTTQGLYFLGYEFTKSMLPSASWSSFVAGVCAQLWGSIAWVPMDVIKERLQVG